MRKQTKLVAVLSAAALLAIGASMTSFAAGWQKDDDGSWHYYDGDDDMIEDEWKKDGGKWFYLDEDGNMATDQWVDDDYYVGEDGAMLINQWKKTFADEDEYDPEDGGEHWYYFGSKGKKITDQDKRINGKTYYFDEDGKMYSGWFAPGGRTDIAYYLGEEDDGARKENQWLWLENSADEDDDLDDDDTNGMTILNCADDDGCDDEGWYWFGSDGKTYHDTGKKKINGRYYMFNEHGQLLYEWINDNDTRTPLPGSSFASASSASPTNAVLDGNVVPNDSNIGGMLYYNPVEEGWRSDGWYEIDGAEDVGTDGDTDWYYFDKGEPKRADGFFDVTSSSPTAADYVTTDDDGAPVFVARIKVDSVKGKQYFAFDELGRMQDGLQFVPDDNGFYYFDSNGYQKEGKVSDVECDDDSYSFRFETKNGHKGRGVDGEKDNYLYFKGRLLEADDDYKFYAYNNDVYLVNKNGKIQKAKSGKKYDSIENDYFSGKDVKVTTNNGGQVASVQFLDDDGNLIGSAMTAAELIDNAIQNRVENGTTTLRQKAGRLWDEEGKYGDRYVAIPFIQLYDDDVYTYRYDETSAGSGEYELMNPDWVGLNQARP